MKTVREHTASIYLIFDAEGTPCYVGKSEYPAKRFREHRTQQRHDWAASYLVIETVDRKDSWKDREEFWITYYRQWYPLKNISKGGRGSDSYGVFYENKDEITALLKANDLTLTEIARRFNVSRELIRHIAIGLKLKSGHQRRAAHRKERARKETVSRPAMARFINRCRTLGLQWELLPLGRFKFQAGALSVEGLTVRLMSSNAFRLAKVPGREYIQVGAVTSSQEWDIVAYELPDGRWLFLDQPNQIVKTTSFAVSPIKNYGCKQHRHDWFGFIEAWNLFKQRSHAELRALQAL